MKSSLNFLSLLAVGFFGIQTGSHALTLIASEADWEALPTTATDNLALSSDIVFTASPKQIDLGSYNFDGRHHTIQLPAGSFTGLFKLSGGHIQNLNIDLASASLASSAGALVAGSSDTTSNNYGQLTRCSVYSSTGTAISGADSCGGLVGENFGNGSSRISDCISSLDINESDLSGGIAGPGFYGTIANCQMKGSLGVDSRNCGGILSSDRPALGIASTITQCVMSGNVNGILSGGIVGQSFNSPISKSIMTGTTQSDTAGAILGQWQSTTNGEVDILTDCYVASTDASTGSSMIAMVSSVVWNVTLRVKNSYMVNEDSLANSSSRSIVNSLTYTFATSTNSFVFDNTYGASAAANTVSSAADKGWTVDSSTYSSDTSSLEGSFDSSWDSSIWEAVSTGYPLLKVFKSSLWVGYGNYAESPEIPPHLQLAANAGNIELSWPGFWSDWSPQVCTDLGSGSWDAVSESVTGETTQSLSVSTSGGGAKFFRLTQ
ncbi:hypothetical protein [Coraliomargarita parva]|uniref:hypothetical protein n=1 Tax=Coraliomargarita parva TaxID=3014050 RepID=UPI0022B5C96C|nr:hypothetical protein [Coraliomargarita parva]